MQRTAILPGVALAIGLSMPSVSAQSLGATSAGGAAAACFRLVKQLKSDFADYRAARTDAIRVASSGGAGSIGGRTSAQLSVGLRIVGKGKPHRSTPLTAFATFRQKQKQTLAEMQRLEC